MKKSQLVKYQKEKFILERKYDSYSDKDLMRCEGFQLILKASLVMLTNSVFLM